jgi:hypothetical protein
VLLGFARRRMKRYLVDTAIVIGLAGNAGQNEYVQREQIKEQLHRCEDRNFVSLTIASSGFHIDTLHLVLSGGVRGGAADDGGIVTWSLRALLPSGSTGKKTVPC